MILQIVQFMFCHDKDMYSTYVLIKYNAFKEQTNSFKILFYQIELI